MNNTEEMIKDLNTEDFLSSIFIILGLLSIYGDQVQKKYIQTNNQEYQKQANNIFDTIIFITFILYIFKYFKNIDSSIIKIMKKLPNKKKSYFKFDYLVVVFF